MTNKLLLVLGLAVAMLSACGETETSSNPCAKCVAPAHGAVTCVDEVCGFECNRGYVPAGLECLPSEELTCCGTGCEDCTALTHAADVSCDEGSCKASSCEESYHLESGACVADSAEACGAQRVNCKELEGVKSATCVKGACVVASCDEDFHLKRGACVADTASECGIDLTDCTQHSHAALGGAACENGVCAISACVTGYHVAENACVADMVTACGAQPIDCLALANVEPSDVSCKDGACKVEGCVANYHLAGNSCVADSAAECGAEKLDCVAEQPLGAVGGVTCAGGACVVTECIAGHHVHGNACVVDTNRACGTTALDCMVAPNRQEQAIDMACQGGLCVATGCNAGSHLSTGHCHTDTPADCGVHGRDCSAGANLKPNASAMGCSQARCVATACQPNYHLMGEVCESDEVSACGNPPRDCATVTIAKATSKACVGGLCKAGGCEVGYHLVDGACVADTILACGVNVLNCNLEANRKENASYMNCAAGECVAIGCNAGYRLASGACVVETDDACGTAAINCNTATVANSLARKCVVGVCKAASCVGGYHLLDGACLIDTVTACGDGPLNCTVVPHKKDNSAAMECIGGKCLATECIADYHLSTGSCAADTNTECGASKENCTLNAGVLSSRCVAGACEALSCVSDYHLKNKACAADTKSECGVGMIDCGALAGVDQVSCSGGACVATSCQADFHVKAGVCTADVPAECGTLLTNCNAQQGVSSAQCVAGACKATLCLATYHLKSDACVQDTAGECGSGMVNCLGTPNIVTAECVAGNCEALSCAANFHPNGALCEADSPTACGPTAINCMASPNYISGAATMLCDNTVCKLGACRYDTVQEGQACVPACGGIKCLTTIARSTETSCKLPENTCIASKCEVGYHPSADGLSCEVDSVTACGSYHADCSLYKGGETPVCASGKCQSAECQDGYLMGSGGCERISDVFGGKDLTGPTYCARLEKTGAVHCWGGNTSGQLGVGHILNVSKPEPAMVGEGIVKAAVHSSHSCFLKNNGSVLCAGLENYGQLGNGKVASSEKISVPVPVLGGGAAGDRPHQWVATDIGVGINFSCALTAEETVKCWGYFWYLGNGVSTSQALPVDVPLGGVGRTAKRLSVGHQHACAILDNGEIRCWGYNDGMQLGTNEQGTANPAAALPPLSVKLPVGTSGVVRSVHTGVKNTCAVMSNDQLLCWGANTSFQAGFIPATTSGILPSVPTYRSEASSGSQVSIGSGNVCFLENGAVSCWGANNNRQFDYTRDEQPVTAEVLPIRSLTSGVSKLAAGYNSMCVIMDDGSVRCWGSQSAGGLGNGYTSSDNVGVPGPIKGAVAEKACPGEGCFPSCSVGFLPSQGTCLPEKSDRCCGANCLDCATVFAKGLGQCNAGVCELASCAPGKHLSGTACVDDSLAHCGAENNSCASLAGSNGVAVADCIVGACRVVQCAANYHLNAAKTACEADSVDNCGAAGRKCADANASENLCVAGVCRVSNCGPGYHTNALADATACLADGAMDCGASRVSCVGMGDLEDYESGSCIAGACNDAGGNATCAPGFFRGPEGCEGASSIAGNYATHCVITSDSHGLQCWGSNGNAKAGTGAAANTTIPVPTPVFPYGVEKVAMGTRHTCLVTERGLVYCWGYNGNYQVGTGDKLTALTPVAVVGQNWKAVDVAVAYSLTCALTNMGGVKCWGDGTNLQNPVVARIVPTDMPGLESGVTRISAGNNHFCALQSDEAKCWGSNDRGVVGQWNGTEPDTVYSPSAMFAAPQSVPGANAFGASPIMIGTDEVQCVLRTIDGKLVCWGNNSNAAVLGIPAGLPVKPFVHPLSDNVSAFSISKIHACAIVDSTPGTHDRLKCWGNNEALAVMPSGMGTYVPTTVAGMETGVRSVVASAHGGGAVDASTCVVKTDGSVWCWGKNTSFALGNGGVDKSLSPVPTTVAVPPNTYVEPPNYPGKATSCIAGFKAAGNTCLPENSVVCCGATCQNCLDLANTATSSCNDTATAGTFVCEALTCAAGFHVASGACVAD